MRKAWIYKIFALLLSLTTYGVASTAFNPNTTLDAEKGNNTSTADSFQGTSNGNLAPTNVSKVDIHSLLYSGNTTKIYAHLMPWWVNGGGSHVNIGYSSNDPNQVARQYDDMVSRGIQGIVIDWYGQNSATSDGTAQLMLQKSEQNGSDFKVAIMEDQGAIKGCSDCTGAVVNNLTYVIQKYAASSAYMRVNGRPVIFFFGSFPVDWNYIRNNVPGNPLFIFENAGGYSSTQSNGAFGWVEITGDPTAWGSAYLDYFYKIAGMNGSETTFGAAWKGFNDSIAAWTAHRVVNQNCGHTWIDTLRELNNYFSSSNQLQNLQLVTWNDYEEGTAIETGVDNCMAFNNVSVSGQTLSWSVNGDESTLNQYNVFISKDGQNLMYVTAVSPSTHSLDLSKYGFPQGAYTMYVKAIGLPSIRNHISGPAGYTAPGPPAAATTSASTNNSSSSTSSSSSSSSTTSSGSSSSTSASASPASTTSASSTSSIALTATPNSLSVTSGQSVSTTVTLTPTGTFGSAVTLACSGLPTGATCQFSQSVLTPGSKAATAQLTVTTAGTTTTTTAMNKTNPVAFAFFLPGLGFGMFVLGDRRRSRKFWSGVAAVMIVALAIGATGCGGGSALNVGSKASTTSSTETLASTSQTASAVPAGAYTFTITATSGTVQRSTTATLVVH